MTTTTPPKTNTKIRAHLEERFEALSGGLGLDPELAGPRPEWQQLWVGH